MAQLLQHIIIQMTQGFRDSVCGLKLIYKLYIENKNKNESDSAAVKQEPMTALAKRRAERNKDSLQQGEVKTSSEPNVLQRILLCCAWNGGLFWLSIFLFNYIVIPSLQGAVRLIFGNSSSHNAVWQWLASLTSFTFAALWILPLFIMSKVVNAIWFQDIADAAYKRTRGRPQMMSSVSRMVADLLFSVTLQAFFLIQGMLVCLLPIPGLGAAVSFLHMALLYALYSFEYRWFNMGVQVHKRLELIEQNWPYFLGFGLPLVVLTSMPQSYVISGCVFSILFPLFIISGNEAEPSINHFDFPLRIFAPVIYLTDSIFHFTAKPSKKTSDSSVHEPSSN